MNEIIPELKKAFNDKKIFLHDTAKMSQKHDNVEPYLAAIKNSKWYGPYKSISANFYFFAAINEQGDNEHFVYLWFTLNQSIGQDLMLCFYKNTSPIAPSHMFRFKFVSQQNLNP